MRAVVTGARGQDGTLLCALLRAQGAEVVGIGRPGSRKDGPFSGVALTDIGAVATLIRDFAPDQVFHLAASHHSSEQAVDIRFEREMVETNFRAAEILTAAIAEYRPSCRILLAGTSMMYRAEAGDTRTIDESTAMHPMSFYGRTKSWSRELLSHFRERWGVFGCTAILFNHESTLRSPHFVTRKVTMAAARAKRGEAVTLNLLDVNSRTDWSSASDVVEGMRLALAAAEPADYVLASGVARPVSELLDAAFNAVSLDWRNYVTSSAPAGQSRGTLVGDATRARQRLGWRTTVGFETMVREMVMHDLALLERPGIPSSS